MASVERRRELGAFLRDRRARLLPGDVGIPSGPRRRVQGLRREEVATLAGVGVTWYTMLENGSADGASTATLEAVAGALRLTPAERAYVLQLAIDEPPHPPSSVPGALAVAAVDAIAWAPAYLCTARWDVLAWNRAMTLVWGIEPPGSAPFNIVERMFRDPVMRARHGERFPQFARALVAMVRMGAGMRAEDEHYRTTFAALHDDALFAQAWETYDIALPLGSIVTTIDVPNLGAFTYEALTLPLPTDDGHAIVMQIPDIESAERLRNVQLRRYR